MTTTTTTTTTAHSPLRNDRDARGVVTLTLADPNVSRRHAEVRVTNDGPHQVAHLRDLGSTNGSYVNGEQVDACPLHDGDRITVGRTSVIFRLARR